MFFHCIPARSRMGFFFFFLPSSQWEPCGALWGKIYKNVESPKTAPQFLTLMLVHTDPPVSVVIAEVFLLLLGSSCRNLFLGAYCWLAVMLYILLSLLFGWQQRALWPQFFKAFEKSCWFLVCSGFFLLWRWAWWLSSFLYDRLETASPHSVTFENQWVITIAYSNHWEAVWPYGISSDLK